MALMNICIQQRYKTIYAKKIITLFYQALLWDIQRVWDKTERFHLTSRTEHSKRASLQGSQMSEYMRRQNYQL